MKKEYAAGGGGGGIFRRGIKYTDTGSLADSERLTRRGGHGETETRVDIPGPGVWPLRADGPEASMRGRSVDRGSFEGRFGRSRSRFDNHDCSGTASQVLSGV